MARDTRQRRALCAVLARAERPLTVHELLAAARAEVPSLGIATVYRLLAELRRQGEVASVEVPGHPVSYEATRRGHHHHFRCRGCRTLFPLPGCVEGLERLLPAGFRAEHHEIVISGLCGRCAALSPAAP